jgi:hypothetical protein
MKIRFYDLVNILIRTAAAAAIAAFAPQGAAVAQQTVVTGTAGRSIPREIRGRIVNAVDRSPLGSVQVKVFTMTGAPAAARVLTSADGNFRIKGVPPGRYSIRIRALGYIPRELRSVVVGPAARGLNVGSISMTTATLKLQTFVVTAQQRAVQLAPDRNTYVVQDMPTTRGGTAIDVLRNVPAVDVDIDNIVSLRGNSGVVVEINGRKSPMKPAQLGNFLAQLPADMVAKVEVIPNPSARDDPEGVAGIINIVLKSDVSTGFSGGLTLSGGTTGHAEAGGNLGYEHGPLTAYGSYGFMRDDRPRQMTIFRQNLYATPTTFLEEQGLRTEIPQSHTVTASVGYKLGPHDMLSEDLMYSTRSEAGTNAIHYRNLGAARNLTGLNDRLTQRTHSEYNLESTVGYKHTFAGDQHQLSSEFRVFRGREGGPNQFTTQSFTLDGLPSGGAGLESQNGWEQPDETSFKLDYSQPLSSRVRLETGYKGSLQSFHTTLDTRLFDTAQRVYVTDPTQTSDFTYRELVNAGYGMLDAQLGKFVVQGGLRVERATTRFHLSQSGTSYDNPYNSVFPSALVAYNIDDARQVKLSYSTRIWRPDDTDFIDPTRHYQDPLNVSVGNPYLKPQYTRALEIGLQQTMDRMTLQVTPFFRHTLDAVRRLRSIDSAGVATTTFVNAATNDSYGTDATVSLSGDRLSGFAGASAFRQVSNASNLAPGLSARTFGWTARTNVSLRVSKTFDLQTLLFYRGPMTVEQGRIASQMRFSLAARQKLMSDRVDLTLRLIDPFNTDRERFTTIDPAFYQVSNQRRLDRGVLLSVNWNFGKPQKEQASATSDPTGSDSGSS